MARQKGRLKMISRIDENTTSIKTLNETAQDLRYFLKHNLDNMEAGEHRDGFEYACEVFENIINEKVDTMRPMFPEFEPWEIEGREVVCWKDYKGNTLLEGDWIVHPEGEKGVIVKKDSEDPYKKWRVKYEGDDYDLSLALQISEKGKAVKLVK